MSQEGKLRPHEEWSCDSINSQVAEVMMDLGFEHVVSIVSRSPCHMTLQPVSIRGRKYDRAMATYLILCHKTPKVKGWTIKVRPFPFPDSNSCSPSPPTGMNHQDRSPKSQPVPQLVEVRDLHPRSSPSVWLLGLPLHPQHQQ